MTAFVACKAGRPILRRAAAKHHTHGAIRPYHAPLARPCYVPTLAMAVVILVGQIARFAMLGYPFTSACRLSPTTEIGRRVVLAPSPLVKHPSLGAPYAGRNPCHRQTGTSCTDVARDGRTSAKARVASRYRLDRTASRVGLSNVASRSRVLVLFSNIVSEGAIMDGLSSPRPTARASTTPVTQTCRQVCPMRRHTARKACPRLQIYPLEME